MANSHAHVLTFHDWKRIQESETPYRFQPLNEGWTPSDILHAVGDVVSVTSDCIWPGTGAVVDIIQAITYFLESNASADYVESSSAAIAGIVSLASLALVGPMQTLAMETKALLISIRTGLEKGASKVSIALARAASTKIVKFLQGIVSTATKLSATIVNLVKNAAETKLGAWIIAKFGSTAQFVTWINKFFNEKVIKNLNSFIVYLGTFINPAAPISNLTAPKIVKDYSTGTAKSNAANAILQKGVSEVKVSQIPTFIKYAKKQFQSPEQEFQRDTSHDMKPVVRPLPIKRNA